MSVVAASTVSTAQAFCPGHITGFLAKASDLVIITTRKTGIIKALILIWVRLAPA